MLIQCPSCGTRAKLPDSKEGAKVRCPECEFVYVARPPGASGRGRRSGSNTTLPIAVGTGLVVLVVLLIYLTNRGGDTERTPVVEDPPVLVEEQGDTTGWDSPPVLFCRKLHELAWAKDAFQLERRLDLARLWAERAAAEGGEAPSPADFAGLPIDDRLAFKSDLLDEICSEEPENLVAAWEPFDGEVVEETDEGAVVRLKVEPRAPGGGLAFRWIEWRLARDGEGWRAYHWERWISPAEQKAERVARARKIEKKTLSDGSFVVEAEPGPVPYLEETTPEERQRIEELIDRLTDLDRFDQFQSLRELEEIGKPAIPGLLTRVYQLYQGGLDTEEEWTRIGLVHQALTNLTGYVTTFKPSEALGATRERQISGLKQWFGWYHRKFRRFDPEKIAAEETDLLEETLQPRNEREARELERIRREQEQEELDRKRREARGGGR